MLLLAILESKVLKKMLGVTKCVVAEKTAEEEIRQDHTHLYLDFALELKSFRTTDFDILQDEPLTLGLH